MPLNIGQMRHRVQIQSRDEENIDDYGEEDAQWSTYAIRWAAIYPLAGRELLRAQQVNPETSARVIMRAVDGINSSHRLLHGDDVLEIVSIADNQKQGERIEVMCKYG